MGAAESTPEGENQNAVGVPTTEPVSDSAPAAHKPNSNTKSSRHSRVRQATSAGPRHSVLDSPYDLIVQIRGAKRVGKSSLRRRLCGEEFDIDRYAPSVGTEEAIIDWVYCAQQGQHEMSVPVKIVDVVDIDGEETESSAVIVLVSPCSRRSLEYARRLTMGLSVEIPLLLVYNFRDVLEDIDVGKIEVFFADVQDLANEVRLSRLRQRQRRALLMHAQLSEAEVDELITGLGVETDTALELSGRADLLVNVLEASMRDCFGLVVLQQYLDIPLRNKQRRQLEDKIKLLRSSLHSGHAYYELCRSKYSYELHVEKLSRSRQPGGGRRVQMSHGSSGRLGLDGDSMATRYSNGNANDMSGDSLRAPERASVTVGTDHFVHRSKNQDDKPTFSAAEKEGADAADAHSVDRSGQKTINLIPDSIVECIPVVAGPGAELSSFLNSSSDEDLSRASDVETVSNVEISDRPDRDSNTDPIYTDISSMPVQTEPAPTNSKDLPALQEVDGVVESYHENPRLDRKTSTGSDESERRDQSAKKKILVKSKQLDIEQDQKKSSHRRSKRKDDPPLTSEDEDTSPALTPAVATYSRLKKPVRRAAPLASAAVSVATSSHDALNEISNYDKQNVVRDAKAALLRVETETEQILADKKSISDHPEDIGHELHAVPSNAVMIISKNNADYSVADSINIDSFREDIMTEELLVDNKDDSNEIKLVKPAVFNACSHPCGSKSLSSDDRHEESITDNIQFDKEAEISEVTDNHISTTDEAHAIGYLPKDIKNEPQVIAFKTPENRSDLLVADSIDIDSFRQDCVPDEFFADSEEDD